ncbi:hypothetical protein Tco_0712740 [Tanacetum coccineum]
MLDRTDFESWQQRIRLYCLGKDNGENIMKSITEGPFQMGTFIQTPAEDAEETEGALQLGPERARVFTDLSAEEKERYKANIRATNILLSRNELRKDTLAIIKETILKKQCKEELLIAGECCEENNATNFDDNVEELALMWTKSLKLINAMHFDLRYNMADENVPAPTPTRSDDQILPFAARVPIGKSNFVLDLQKKLELTVFSWMKTGSCWKDNVIRDLKVLVSNVNDRSCEPYNANDVTDLLEQNERLRAEIEKVKQHYKEMFESIKITRTSTNAKTSSLLTQIEDLKAQLEGNLKVATRSSVKPKVLAPGMYAIDVKPIPHPLKNNRSAHLNYISHLKESVETVREIVEEARVVKPLDNALNYACQYTKLSQELLEYVIGTCPKSFSERDNKAPSTPVTRKKQVTFSDKPGTSSSNTQKHEVHQKVQPSNVQVIPSTGVSSSTCASGSKPRSNTKHNRILPAKSVNNKKVEDHPRTNKSVWTKVNREDSSISSKAYQACYGKQSSKLFANVGYQWRPTGKKFSSRKLNCGYQWRPTGKKFALGELCPLTRLPVTCGTDHPLVWINKKSQENSQKRASTDTRIRRVQKPEAKPGKSSLSQIQSIYGQ